MIFGLVVGWFDFFLFDDSFFFFSLDLSDLDYLRDMMKCKMKKVLCGGCKRKDSVVLVDIGKICFNKDCSFLFLFVDENVVMDE